MRRTVGEFLWQNIRTYSYTKGTSHILLAVAYIAPPYPLSHHLLFHYFRFSICSLADFIVLPLFSVPFVLLYINTLPLITVHFCTRIPAKSLSETPIRPSSKCSQMRLCVCVCVQTTQTHINFDNSWYVSIKAGSWAPASNCSHYFNISKSIALLPAYVKYTERA